MKEKPKIEGNVTMKIVAPLIIEWKCPVCQKDNREEFYSAPGRARVQCPFCGKIYIAER